MVRSIKLFFLVTFMHCFVVSEDIEVYSPCLSVWLHEYVGLLKLGHLGSGAGRSTKAKSVKILCLNQLNGQRTVVVSAIYHKVS